VAGGFQPAQRLGNLNGVAIALAYAAVNSCLALLLAFGVNLSQAEGAAILAFVNNALVLVAYMAHNSARHSHSVIPAEPFTLPHVEVVPTEAAPPPAEQEAPA
jgi:hypothetical protein